MVTFGAAKTVTNPATGAVFTISGVGRRVRLPEVDGEPFDMEFDIALFEGKLGPLGGFKKPLCKFIIAEGSGLSVQALMDRLGKGLVEPREPNIDTTIWALVDDDWPFFTEEVRDPYHGNQLLSVVYVWPK